jgi:hypothetical protein
MKVVKSTIKEFSRKRQFRTRALRQARPADLRLAAPHPVYTLTLQDAVGQQSVDAATATAWRYLVQDGRKAIASAEALLRGPQEVESFSRFNEGPFVRSTERAIVMAESLPDVADGTYEVRVLQAPAVYVVALWLKDRRGDQDILIPLDPAPSELEAGQCYTDADFMAVLVRLAEEQGRFDSSPTSD